jgi:hypothetical protein
MCEEKPLGFLSQKCRRPTFHLPKEEEGGRERETAFQILYKFISFFAFILTVDEIQEEPLTK